MEMSVWTCFQLIQREPAKLRKYALIDSKHCLHNEETSWSYYAYRGAWRDIGFRWFPVLCYHMPEYIFHRHKARIASQCPVLRQFGICLK